MSLSDGSHTSRTYDKNPPALASNRILARALANGRSQILADYNRTLEIEVAQRTIELSEINARLELEIEQRQQSEKMIRQERDLNLTILENSPNFFIAIDPERTIL